MSASGRSSRNLLENATFVQEKGSLGEGFAFRDDGQKLIRLRHSYSSKSGNVTSQLLEYDLATPWDISTATQVDTVSVTYDNDSAVNPSGAFAYERTGITIEPDGLTGHTLSYMRYSGVGASAFDEARVEITFQNPWQVAGATASNVYVSGNTSSYDHKNITFSSDGLKYTIVDGAATSSASGVTRARSGSLASPFDGPVYLAAGETISSVGATQGFYNLTAVCYSSDGMVGLAAFTNDGTSRGPVIVEYELQSPFKIDFNINPTNVLLPSQMSPIPTTSNNGNFITQLLLSPDESKMFAGVSSEYVWEFSL